MRTYPHILSLLIEFQISPIIATIVFILAGLYVMKSCVEGQKKKRRNLIVDALFEPEAFELQEVLRNTVPVV